ncbi:MAG: hypothetical protein N2376_09545 [Clostridia bacterium]|nr:hypothetical protein [Clostridia bacterium]
MPNNPAEGLVAVPVVTRDDKPSIVGVGRRRKLDGPLPPGFPLTTREGSGESALEW